MSGTCRRIRIDAGDHDRRTIPPLLKVWAEAGRGHGGIIFIDDKTILLADLGGQVRALSNLTKMAAKWDWTNRICFLQRYQTELTVVQLVRNAALSPPRAFHCTLPLHDLRYTLHKISAGQLQKSKPKERCDGALAIYPQGEHQLATRAGNIPLHFDEFSSIMLRFCHRYFGPRNRNKLLKREEITG